MLSALRVYTGSVLITYTVDLAGVDGHTLPILSAEDTNLFVNNDDAILLNLATVC